MVDGQGQATILDDEPLPALAVGDAAPAEGNSGTAPAALTLTLVPVSGRDVAVDWSHVAGTATPGRRLPGLRGHGHAARRLDDVRR